MQLSLAGRAWGHSSAASLFGIRLVLATYGAMVGQDEHMTLWLLPVVLVQGVVVASMLTAVERVSERTVQFLLRLLILLVLVVYGAYRAGLHSDSRGGSFIALAVVFDQAWNCASKGRGLSFTALLVAVNGITNSLARQHFGNSAAWLQVGWVVLAMAGWAMSRQRRLERERNEVVHLEEKSFVAPLAELVGAQEIDLDFHDAHSTAMLMAERGSESARSVLDDDLGPVLVSLPKTLGVLPLGAIIAGRIDPPGAWAYPITAHRRENIEKAVRSHPFVERVSIENYDELVRDPSAVLVLRLNDTRVEAGPPIVKRSFRFEPDVWVFVFATLWAAGDFVLPGLPRWLRTIQVFVVVTYILLGVAVQRFPLREKEARVWNVVVITCLVEFFFVGARFYASRSHADFPPTTSLSILVLVCARASYYVPSVRMKVLLSLPGLIGLVVFHHSVWAWFAANRVVEMGTVAWSALFTVFLGQLIVRERRAHLAALASELRAEVQMARVKGYEVARQRWQRTLELLNNGVGELADHEDHDVFRLRIDQLGTS